MIVMRPSREMNDDVVVVVITRPGLEIIRKKQGIGCNRHKLAYPPTVFRVPSVVGLRYQPGKSTIVKGKRTNRWGRINIDLHD